MFDRSKNDSGFTLAEVLITIGIIGIVAAMTLPIIITSQRNKQIATQLKKIYSVLNTAIQFAVNDYGDMKNWDVDLSYFAAVSEQDRIRAFQTYIVPYLDSIKTCTKTDSNLDACWKNAFPGSAPYYNISGGGAYQLIAITILKDGVSCGVTDITTNTALVCDINGYRKPNRLGRDQFAFVFNPQKNNLEFERYYLSRDDLLNPSKFDANGGACVSGSRRYDGVGCGALIQKDGWTLSKDYP